MRKDVKWALVLVSVATACASLVLPVPGGFQVRKQLEERVRHKARCGTKASFYLYVSLVVSGKVNYH